MRWNKGIKEDGSDSIAEQIADENHWPRCALRICVVSDKEKDTSSTSGMETSSTHVPAEIQSRQCCGASSDGA